MSEQIVVGLRRMDAVLAYGIDGLAEQSAQAGLLSDMGLNAEVFFRELYVSRPSAERELFAQMDSGALHTFIVGSIGCGKTTLLHNVLRQYSTLHRLPLVLLDMKTSAIASPDSYAIAARIEDDCKRQIELFLQTLVSGPGEAQRRDPPGLIDLAKILLEPPNHQFISAPRFQFARRLTTMHALSEGKRAGQSLAEWLDCILTTTVDPVHAEVLKLFTDFTTGMTLVECAFAVSELGRRTLGATRRSKILIAVDNIDAIEDPNLRDQLVSWMKQQSSSYSAVATFTTSIRPQNMPVARDGSSNPKALWGEDSSPILKLSVDDSDVDDRLLREWETYLQSQFYDRYIEDPEYAELTEDQRKRQAFDDMVHVRRLDFVAKAVDEGRISGLTRSDLHAVSRAAKEVFSVGSVVHDIRMQSNGNRRVMLAGAANFLEYVCKDLGLKWDLVGFGASTPRPSRPSDARELRGSAIKSLYYRFLGSGRPTDVQPPVFDSRVFDPVKMVMTSGWKGRTLDPPRGTKSVTHSCCGLLVLLGVYNACGNTLSLSSDNATRVQTVADRCRLLGLSPTDVYRTIEHTIQAVGVRFAGVFDIDHFLPIYKKEHKLDGSERIIATDRCRRLLTTVIRMFNYLCERLRQNSGSGKGTGVEDKELAYRGLVSGAVVDGFADWVSKAALIETWWIEAVHAAQKTGSLATALEQYSEDFAVKRTHASVPSLLTQGIAKSAMAYLDFALKKHLRPEETELQQSYLRARNDLAKINLVLETVCKSLRKGQGWGIPRNEAIRYN